VRSAVAQRLDCPPETLSMLSTDSVYDVLEIVAGHPNTKSEDLLRMASDLRDALGNRMKAYEAESRTSMPQRRYTIVRLDGKAFHTYTKGAVLIRY